MFQEAPINLRSSTPEQDSIRTIAELTDFACDHNPNHIYCYQAENGGDISAGEINLRPVKFQDLKRGVLSCISFLKPKLEFQNSEYQKEHHGANSCRKRAPVGLFMESDLALPIHLIALVAMGIPVLLISAKVSVDSLQSIVAEARATTLIVSPRLQQTARRLVDQRDNKTLPSLIIPMTYAELLKQPAAHKLGSICSPNHYNNERDQNVILIPSSGTTGKPKINYNSHRYLLAYASGHEFRDRTEAGGLNVCTLPLFHAYGLMPIFMSMQVGSTFCITICPDPPNGLQTVRLLQLTNAKSLMTVPSILEEIDKLNDESSIELLSKLTFVACGGGPLKTSLGERLVRKGVALVNMYGTSEVGAIATTFIPGADYDWRYIRIRQDMDIQLMTVENSTSNTALQRVRMRVKVFGQSRYFEPSDEFVCRPENPKRDIRPVGRMDDALVLGNGEKISPRFLESALTDLAEVRAAVICGNGRFELIALVELSEEYFRNASTEKKIWEAVKAANEYSDAHARIFSREAIRILDPNKALPRSDKGSIARASAYHAFLKDIELTYERLEKPKETWPAAECDTFQNHGISESEHKVTAIICQVLQLQNGQKSLNIDEDFFELGMDSLQATQLGRMLRDLYSDTIPTGLSRNFVYQYPTVAKICNRLQEPSMFNSRDSNHRQSNEDLAMLYINQAFFESKSMLLQTDPGAVILLVESRGSVGSYLLRLLLQRSEISTVICMDRDNNGAAIHSSQQPQKQSPATTALGSNRMEQLTIDFSMPLFGLSLTHYYGPVNRITHIVHNAWPIDLKRSVQSFDRHIKTTKNLLRLALDAHEQRPHVRPYFQFISSIATVARCHETSGFRLIPENIFTFEAAAEIGYAKAKYVSEKLVEAAQAQQPDSIQASIVRLGQISGSHDTADWNMKEFIPILCKTSRDLGCLPRVQGTFSWLAADDAAAILVDLIFSSLPSKLVYHVENPVRQSWGDFMDRIANAYGIKEGNIVDLDQWIEKVRRAHDPHQAQLAAAPLIDFFENGFVHLACGGVVLDTYEARKRSHRLAKMDALPDILLSRYVDLWNFDEL